ncbi:MAG: Rap1a/Tai family immunity protein [Pseudomonadota bacterium]
MSDASAGVRRIVTALPKLSSAAIAMALLTGTPGHAAEEKNFMVDTTGDLAALCGVGPENANYSAAIHMCQGYLLGVHHFHEALAAELEDDIYCTDTRNPRPSRNEIVAEFVNWVDANPTVAASEALDGLLQWAAVSFPCK